MTQQGASSNKSQPEVKSLIHKRSAIKRLMSNIQSQINKVASADQLSERLKNCHDDFFETQLKLDTLNDNEDDHEWNMFLDMYNTLSADLEALTTSNSKIISKSNNADSLLRLPAYELPKFSGDFDEWYSFYETFTCLIHNNKDLKTIEKFHFLKSNLIGEAASVIYGMDVTANNYDEAWKLLTERYHNTRITIQKHVRALFELPQFTKDLVVFLRDLHDKINKHLRALSTLGQPVESWDALLIYLITSRLDNNTAKEWEFTLKSNEMPTIKGMLTFINKKWTSLQMVNKTQISQKPQVVTKEKRYAHAATSSNNKCVLCSHDHQLFQCKKFIDDTVESRRNNVKKHNLCFNCLRKGHRSNDCRASRCKKCQRAHNTLLHMEQKIIKNEIDEQEEAASNTCMVGTATNYVLLATAQIQIKNKFNKLETATALLDSGSQSSLITKTFANKLGLPQKDINISLSGITGKAEAINKSMNINISSKTSNFNTNLDCLVVDRITEKMPLVVLDKKQLEVPEHIKLADANFHNPKDIDVLLGANIFWQTIKNGRIEVKDLTFTETIFGWVISGNVTKTPKVKSICNHSVINFDMEKFWRIENFESDNKIMTINDKKVEEHFQKTFKRDATGRFIVKLPYKNNDIKLGESYKNAVKRYYNLESKLQKNKDLFEQYSNFMKEYKQLGHMKEINHTNYLKKQPHFYLPHHGVVKEDSLTTKLRVVFDGSASTSNRLSLNDNLEKGPTIQDDLFNILLRFRTKTYVISADITKMYRQVLIDENQRKLQRILWRDHKHDPIKTYELQTVTYGTASAAYLAIRCMHQLAIENTTNAPLEAKKIMKDFYVDDLLTGASTIAEARQIKENLGKILKSGGFELRKWCSNDPKIIDQAEENDSFSVISFDKHDSMKTLGLQWNFKNDILYYASPKQMASNAMTKRAILSNTSKIFDPLGLVGPITVQGKVIMQELWRLKIGWDVSVPKSIAELWHNLTSHWEAINEIEIPRLAGLINKESELHGFCDASIRAYGACIYLKTKNKEGRHIVRLICAKAKVAPLKAQSLPRLELCGAFLLTKLMKTVLQAIEETPGKIVYWTDAKIVLSWIKATDKRWKTFVANRIGQILETSSSDQWFHVKGTQNPADVISRGMSPKELRECELWWQGPQWLQGDVKYKEHIYSKQESEENEEKEKISLCTIKHEQDILKKYSSWNKVIRIVAYCIRFHTNTQANRKGLLRSSTTHITTTEFNSAKIRVIKLLQAETFINELNDLKQGCSVRKSSKIINLQPFLCKEGLIRVGGRLDNADISYDSKYPIILPKSHHITTVIIRHFHECHMHTGVQTTLNAIRQEFWPLHGTNAVKGIIRKCVSCFKFRPQAISHIMGNLPSTRVTQARPFANTGIDFCGPFHIKLNKRRNSSTMKMYIAVFVCLSIKAVHMEVVDDLTTESFLAAYKRFVSRRGKPENTYSDNGKTFVGANKQLKELEDLFAEENSNLMQYMTNNNTKWHFIPPRAPHFGGLWEAAVKSAKTHLKKMVANANLRHDEFCTLVVQIESILNSRPLTTMSSDAKDANPLTPYHFLIGSHLKPILEPSLEPLKINTLSRWQYIEKIKQGFWKRWYSEYLNKLQVRTKWAKNHEVSIKSGQLVLVKEDNVPPTQWPCARVVKTFPGKDGVIRVALIKTVSGEFKRPVVKLCVLPIDID